MSGVPKDGGGGGGGGTTAAGDSAREDGGEGGAWERGEAKSFRMTPAPLSPRLPPTVCISFVGACLRPLESSVVCV